MRSSAQQPRTWGPGEGRWDSRSASGQPASSRAAGAGGGGGGGGGRGAGAGAAGAPGGVGGVGHRADPLPREPFSGGPRGGGAPRGGPLGRWGPAAPRHDVREQEGRVVPGAVP